LEHRTANCGETASLGGKLIYVDGCTIRIFVTNCNDTPKEIWWDYSRRAGMEVRIAEWKHHLGATDFCLKHLDATEVVIRVVLFLLDLPSQHVSAAGLQAFANRRRSARRFGPVVRSWVDQSSALSFNWAKVGAPKLASAARC
jgi:hypothetical protein